MPKLIRLLPALSVLALLLASSVAAQQNTANLKLNPVTTSTNVNQSFTVAIRVSSPNTSISSVQAYLTFPNNLLEVSSISKTGTIASIFVEEPAFNNSSGTIKMTADIASPGFRGSDGLVVTVTFKAKAAGTANVGYTTESAVYGTSGTNSILGTSDTGIYTVQGASTTLTVTPTSATTPAITKAATGTPLPDTATAGQTGLGILTGLSLIGLSAYLKLSKKLS